MRCWNPHCHKLIPLPDIIDGRPARAGQIRLSETGLLVADGQEEPGWEMKGITSIFMCSHCGTEYEQLTRVTAKRDTHKQQGDDGRGDGWD